jgi:hypothetical protein
MSLTAPSGSSDFLKFKLRARSNQWYRLEVAVIAPGQGWDMTATLNGANLPVVKGMGMGVTQPLNIDLGLFKLRNVNSLKLDVNCSQCYFGVFGVVLSNPMSKPVCVVHSSEMINNAQFTSKVICRARGSIVLSDSYNLGWSATATNLSGQSLVLSHGEIDGTLNGWIVPKGSWTVATIFTPQTTYQFSLLFWTLALVGIGLTLLVLRRRRTQSRQDDGQNNPSI